MAGSYAHTNGHAILPASPEHIDIIQSMIQDVYSKYLPRMDKPPALMLADYNEILKTHKVKDADAVKINSLVVDPTAQGHGYGRILMSHAEQVARQSGFTALVLYTNIKMYENLQLYPKLRFVETDRRTGDGYQWVYFRKDLVRVENA